MFRNLYFTLLAAGAFALVGCDSALDIDPQQSISADRALSTPQNVQAVVIGAYDRVSDSDLYGGELFLGPDLLAASQNEVVWTGTFSQPREFWSKNLLVDNVFVEDTWEDAYEVINIANNILSALDVFEDDTAARDAAEGHARFLRGTMYFELVRLWALPWNAGDPNSNPGVPIVLEPTRGVTDADNRPRSNVAEVYAQVIDDLTKARDLLPEDGGDLAGTYAASAMLSRVYLAQGKYADAAQAASRVIEEGGFALAETYAGAFNNSDSSPEYVFLMPITDQDGANDLNLFYGAEENSGRGDIEVTDAYVALFGLTDTRALIYVDEADILRTLKWQGSTTQGIDIPVIRLAEMYLTRAEANLRAGTSVGATPLSDVNKIRARAGLVPLVSVTVEDVLRERRLELSLEGQYLHDLKRTGGTITTSGGPLPATSPRFVYPIPQREIDANPSLTQNAYYL